MPYNVNVLTQKTALEYLENKKSTEQQVHEIVKHREQLKKDLQQVGFIEKVYPSDSNFLLVKVDDADRRYRELIDRELIIRNRTNEPLCKNCLRITVGTESENKALVDSMVQLDMTKKINS